MLEVRATGTIVVPAERGEEDVAVLLGVVEAEQVLAAASDGGGVDGREVLDDLVDTARELGRAMLHPVAHVAEQGFDGLFLGVELVIAPAAGLVLVGAESFAEGLPAAARQGSALARLELVG